MRYCGTLIAVSDMEQAKGFYEQVMEQKVVVDLGVHVSFESGLSLQTDYPGLVGESLLVQQKSNSFQLYFEVTNIAAWRDKLKKVAGLLWIHDIKEYPWGQRVMRFYDYDQVIVEVSESMACVVRRFLDEGLTVEEVAERTMFPVPYVEQVHNGEIQE